MTVVEVGPTTMRGPEPVDDELASAAVEAIDDPLMLVDGRPVAVRRVVSELLRSAVGAGDDELTVVHPTWWSRRRVDVVLDAAGDVHRSVVGMTRAQMLGDGFTAVVEIAVDHVAVIAAGVRTMVRSDDAAICAAVVREIGGRGTVLVDAPRGVGGDALASSIVTALGERGVTATRAGAVPLRNAAPEPTPAAAPPGRSRRRAAPVLAGALLTTVGIIGAAALTDDPQPEPTALLVEGRVGLVVPALWTVARITEGGGSARVQITSPADPAVALHVTQSVLPRPQSVQQVADTLRDALEAEDTGVFTDFRAVDERGGRAVATYRERRAKHQTDWAVLADGALRIAIGCQSPPGRADAVRPACEAAVRSAHAVF
ncbi:type VII secretion-associated protein [Mycolicibacterium baixiangningiae]|uniref:type VII secretion-associated protein n=1 Tax=Mycolicibacterium baixiangningiae TaxID=2761578 RepID=UPI001E2F326F|nr:type VII secretion-associated protein [Mycolicibacterium baixiangningiae]